MTTENILNFAPGQFPTDVPGMAALVELALNLRWSWNHATDEIWRRLDPKLWDSTHNPWVVLQTASRNQIRAALADPAFRKDVDGLVATRRKAITAPAWFQERHSESSLTCAAYFSMEFMLSEALPIYSGGLGNVAGDQLKMASDLGVPVVGIGLLYQQGYFRQVIGEDGAQQALYPYNDPGQLPITPLRLPGGEWLRLEVRLPGYSVWLRAWEVQVGRVRLYLLDSNDAANDPVYRGITSELYGGGSELRLQQELVLGLGGWRLLEALNIKPEVCHLNEGHAAFAILARAASFMRDTNQPFEVALAVTRAGNLFTSHTAVAAGFDLFDPCLVARYLQRYAEQTLGISIHDLLALGRRDPNDSSERFNMAYLATRGAGSVNGVSRLHGEVSRSLFSPLYPRWPIDEVPIGHVTNGVHVPTWDSPDADDLWTRACGKDRWLGTMDTLEADIRGVPCETLWQFRSAARRALIDNTRVRVARQMAVAGDTPLSIEDAKRLFDPNVLTLGFARRFATYKRPDLLLHDRARLRRILSNPTVPVQLIIAGKAHPEDKPGQELIREWIQFIREPDMRPHVVFLSDYDMLLSAEMVQGVDVWINTPRRPWEACGTSGMKVLVNGGLNLSELDGWWAEAWSEDVGWALGDGKEHGADPGWDAIEADALYAMLEREVIPEFYARNSDGVPETWVRRIRESMARLTPRFSANRAVREYTEQHYLPAASAYRQRAADNGAEGQLIVDWQRKIDRGWSSVRFGAVSAATAGGRNTLKVDVFLGSLEPSTVSVELYAAGADGVLPVKQAMNPVPNSDGETGDYAYCVSVPADRTLESYTVRVVPRRDGVATPLEETRILWQR